jgi:hypothetical protein
MHTLLNIMFGFFLIDFLVFMFSFILLILICSNIYDIQYQLYINPADK